MKYLFYILLFLSGLFIGVVLTNYFNRPAMSPEEQSKVILDQIKKVVKLSVVEGNFSEFQDYSDPNIPYSIFNDWDQQLISVLPRSVHLRVQGKVNVGYNFEKLVVSADSKTKTVRISNWPNPEILSLEHDIEYLDKDDYAFHSFDTNEEIKILAKAKQAIEQAAINSDLFQQAEKQRDDLVYTLESLLQTMGWKLLLDKDFVNPEINKTIDSITNSINIK